MDKIMDTLWETVRCSRRQVLSQDQDYAQKQETWDRRWGHFLDTHPPEARIGVLGLIDAVNLLRFREMEDAFFFGLRLGAAFGRLERTEED